MTRTAKSAKNAGTREETAVAKYLDDRLGVTVERRARHGSKDQGDLSGVVTHAGAPVVVEVKNTTRMELSQCLREAEVERENAGALLAVVAHHRKGYPTGLGYVTMTLETFARLLQGD